MTSFRNALSLATIAATALVGAAQAQTFYGTGMLGLSQQGTDSAPYGDNIAADPEFPGAFSTGDGGTGALGVGYDFGNNIRVESRLGLHQSAFDSREVGTGTRAGEEYILDGEIKSKTLTIEGFYDIPTNSAFTPYVKAGLGVARNSYAARLGGAGVAAFDPFDGTTDGFYDAYADQTSTEFTWNVGAGGSVALSDRVSAFGEYQYVSLGDASTGQDAFTDGFEVEAAAHEIVFGLRADF